MSSVFSRSVFPNTNKNTVATRAHCGPIFAITDLCELLLSQMAQTSADDLIINQLQAIFQLSTSYLGQQGRIVFTLQLYLGERVEENYVILP